VLAAEDEPVLEAPFELPQPQKRIMVSVIHVTSKKYFFIVHVLLFLIFAIYILRISEKYSWHKK
jgi:hypothetical protein